MSSCKPSLVHVCPSHLLCLGLWATPQMSSFGGLSFAISNKTTFRGIFTMDLGSGGVNMVGDGPC
jgi:hypothetical protein